jgi:RHS repeat-associated protein
MSRTLRNALAVLLFLISWGASQASTFPQATVTVSGAETAPNGVPDSGSITLAVAGFTETVNYGQYSSPASLAAAFAAMFSRDHIRDGLYAQAGVNGNLPVITFQLTNGQSFNSVNITGPTTSFTLSPSGFTSVASLADSGTVVLQVNGSTIASTVYGAGATPVSVAQGLANNVAAGSPVTVAAVNDQLYITSTQTGSATNNDTYRLETTGWNSASFPQPSFVSVPLSGSLTGGADQNSQGGIVYSYTPGYDPSSNLTSISDAVMGNWQYGYDNLERLTTGQAIEGSYAGQFGCWSYDSFGNRTMEAVSTTACNASPTPTIWAQYATNNQISATTHAVGGVQGYDGAGDVTNDGIHTYLYDAEGRVCAEQGPLGAVGYVYDADGNRVGKGSITSWSCNVTANGYTPTNDYVLDQSGGQMTELALDENGVMAWEHTNVTANGTLIGTFDAQGLHFYLNDPLGTRRAQTDDTGTLEQTCQSLPFGDQLSCTSSLNAPTEHHFTGKERDIESGNDYFGARYYSSSVGRFMSPDWSEDPAPIPYADLENPQSLNFYGYVRNNPVSWSDPTGHFLNTPGSPGQPGGYTLTDTGYLFLFDFSNYVPMVQAPNNGQASNNGQVPNNGRYTLYDSTTLFTKFIVGIAGKITFSGLVYLHSLDVTRATSSYEYWSKQPTDKIVESLKSGAKEGPLTVGKDGRIWNGNTRLRVLEERGYDITTLPSETYVPSTFEEFGPIE